MFVSPATYLDALCLLLGDNSDRSRSLVREFMDITDRQEAKREITTVDDDLVNVYKMLIRSVMTDKTDQENSTASKILLLKIKNNEVIRSHPLERDILTDILSGQEKITAGMIDGYLKKIRNMLVVAEMEAHSRRIFAKTRNLSEIVDPEALEIEITKVRGMFDESMKGIERRQRGSGSKASESYVSLSDPESIKRALDTYMDRNIKGVIKTGLQGLNKALGARGGVGLGDRYARLDDALDGRL